MMNTFRKKDQKKSNEKKEPKNFIFGFGSIINTKSRIKTGGETIGNAIPVEISKKEGYIREWNFQKNIVNATFLGVRKAEEGEFSTNINGIIYPCFENINKFDEREKGYKRHELNKNNIIPKSWQNLPSHSCKIWIYVPEIKHQFKKGPTFNKPILQSYLDICVNGCLEYGLDFLQKFVHTTGNWSRYWLNDRIIARRAWTHEKNYNIIDKYITNFLKEKNIQFKSLLSEDYINLKIKKNCLIKPKLL